MAQKFYTEEYIQDIANAIREKNKLSRPYKVGEMGAAVRALPSGLDGLELTIITTTYTT